MAVLHLAQLLLAAGREADAVTQAAQVLAHDPKNVAARRLMGAALSGSERPETPRSPWPVRRNVLAALRAIHDAGRYGLRRSPDRRRTA